jgi:hypothetical protein
MDNAPSNGTINPALKLPKCVESAPTAQGKTAPPKFPQEKIKPLIRGAVSPNQFVRRETLIGNTDDNPSPDIAAPTIMVGMAFAAISINIPTAANATPAVANLVSRICRRASGAEKSPRSNAPQKNEGVIAHKACVSMRRA